MASFNNVPQTELVRKTAEKLKGFKEIVPPQWAPIVKTGMHKERPPINADWWYDRTASVLRTIALKGPVGVSKLRTRYGGRKRRGHKPPKFVRGSGNILRKVLQQLEKAGLAEKKMKDLHKGRIITTKGIKLLNDAAKDLFTKYPKIKEIAHIEDKVEDAAEDVGSSEQDASVSKE